MRPHGGGGARQNIFNKEWLYLNLQSELGCKVSMYVSFKQDFMPTKSTMSKTSGFDQNGSVERSIM